MKTRAVHGIRLAYVDEGSGTPVVLVHGFPLDHAMWDAQVDALKGQCRVIVPDLRGFGQSDVTEGTVTMEQFADDVAGLLDALGVREPVVLAGLSMGGYVAFQFFRRHRGRLRALVLCDTRAGADTPQAAAARRETAEKVLGEGPGSLVENMPAKLFAAATLKDRPGVAESLVRVIASTDPRAIAAASLGMAERSDVTAMLPEVDCPRRGHPRRPAGRGARGGPHVADGKPGRGQRCPAEVSRVAVDEKGTDLGFVGKRPWVPGAACLPLPNRVLGPLGVWVLRVEPECRWGQSAVGRQYRTRVARLTCNGALTPELLVVFSSPRQQNGCWPDEAETSPSEVQGFSRRSNSHSLSSSRSASSRNPQPNTSDRWKPSSSGVTGS